MKPKTLVVFKGQKMTRGLAYDVLLRRFSMEEIEAMVSGSKPVRSDRHPQSVEVSGLLDSWMENS